MKEKSYLILPGCDDTNRGDQALIWVTVDLAKEAGYRGVYKILANDGQYAQSAKEGIGHIDYVLNHPSTHFSGKSNVRYTPILKLKWALAAVWDLMTREPLVHPFLRRIFLPLYGEKVRRAMAEFRDAEACFVKGGGFLHAHGGFADTYKIYYFLYHIRLAQSFGKNVYIMPNSFGPFKSPLVPRMIWKTLHKCKAVMSRESVSQAMLQRECGVASECFSDLAFHLTADEAFDAKEYLIKSGVPITDSTCVAITVRPYRFPGENDGVQKYEDYKTAMKEFIVWLNGNGYFPVLVEHVFSDMDHENDMICIEEVRAAVPDNCKCGVLSARELTCRQMKCVYGTFDYTVGTRFHSVIFSLSSGVPSIAVTYGGNKGEGIMKDLELSQYAIPMECISVAQLIDAFSDLCRNRTAVTAHLKKKMVRLVREKAEIIAMIEE